MKMVEEICFVLYNIRSAHNVGSIFRTADGVGVSRVYLVGYTPTPFDSKNKYVFPTKADKMLEKTALGAQEFVAWEKRDDILELIERLKKEGFQVIALEQDEKSVEYDKISLEKKVAVILGNEPSGIEKEILNSCDVVAEIPMRGKKNSLNVSVAAGIIGYELTKTGFAN